MLSLAAVPANPLNPPRVSAARPFRYTQWDRCHPTRKRALLLTRLGARPVMVPLASSRRMAREISIKVLNSSSNATARAIANIDNIPWSLQTTYYS
jgi:hypothetical protein